MLAGRDGDMADVVLVSMMRRRRFVRFLAISARIKGCGFGEW